MPSTVMKHSTCISPSVWYLSWMSSMGPPGSPSTPLHPALSAGMLTCIDHMGPLFLQILDGFSQREGPADVEGRSRIWSRYLVPWLPHFQVTMDGLAASPCYRLQFLSCSSFPYGCLLWVPVTTSSSYPFRLWGGISCLLLLPRGYSLCFVGFLKSCLPLCLQLQSHSD